MRRAWMSLLFLLPQRAEPFRVTLTSDVEVAVADELVDLRLQVEVVADVDLPAALLSGCELVASVDGAQSRPVFPAPANAAPRTVRVARGTRIQRTLAVPVGSRPGPLRLSWPGCAGAEVTVRVLENLRDVPVDQLDLQRTRVLLVTSLGTLEIALRPDVAPAHVRNFVTLAQSGFYDGTRFHRVIQGLLAQGGDPNSRDDDPRNDGTGGPGFRLKAEFNDLPHRKGAVSMARDPQDPDSAGSQFFLMHGRVPEYDRQFTVFGEIARGLEVLDRICAVRVRARAPGGVAELPETDVWLKRALVLGVRR